MMTSLFSAVTGMSNHQTRMDVIGDNIANVNTIGFKSSRVSFATGFSQVLQAADRPTESTGGKNAIEVGLGMRIAAVDRVFNQGNFENTGSRTDLAIQGDGFFVVGDGESQYYTRAGNFQIDADGSLLASGGKLHVLGRLADKNGVLVRSSTLEPIVLPFGEKDPARATTEVTYFCNLDANASKAQEFTASLAFTAENIPATGATELNDLDQVSAPLDAGDTITITGKNQVGDPIEVVFTYGAAADGTTLGDLMNRVNSSAGYDSDSPGGSRITLDAAGKFTLRDNLPGNSETTISMSFSDVGSASTLVLPTFVNTQDGTTGTHAASINVYDSRGERHKVEINFTQDVTQDNVWNWEIVVDDGAIDVANSRLQGNSGQVRFNSDGSLLAFEGGPLTFDTPEAQGVVIQLDGGTVGTFDGITQFAAPTTTIALNQDGHGMGVLQDFTVASNGEISGTYSNGITRTLGQIAISRFANPSGLQLAGENIYHATVNSGDPLIGVDNGNVNTVYAGYLELANVDLGREFTDMIIAQRGFQASARVITVADSLLNEVTQLKR